MDHDLIRELYRAAYVTGFFPRRNGELATDYIDGFRITGQPALLRRVLEYLAPLVPPEVDALAGIELGGIPVATALSLHLGVPSVYVRRQRKSYGTGQLVEGRDIAGLRVLLVDDVSRTGRTLLSSLQHIRAEGATVVNALTVIDREEGGEELLAACGVELASPLKASQLRDIPIIETGIVPDSNMTSIARGA